MLQKQKNQRIIHWDVFHFNSVAELGNYKYDFLTKVHKLLNDGHISQIRISLMIHNAEIIVMKDNSGY